ncbi:gluconate:H+ symporter [Flammeovirgaceae bacterium SG7u.111]|nr:gluconate:H+ symporter [Flammeovirgaceae bacterium SG7u.132]WPO36071.1 gluconate:H+ symporter [Flammeovirgaceae bacterium SG7u.111]
MPLVIVALGILVLLVLMIAFRLNAFIALILVALGVGIAEGMNVNDVVDSIQKGVGATLGYLVLVLGFGAMLGGLIAESGAAQKITSALTKSFGIKHIQWAIVLTGFIVGIPMFYSVGFVILIPLVFSIAASTGLPMLYVAIPMVASLSVTHGFLPPHPGPTAIAVIYKADIGMTLVYGILIAIPTIVLAGPMFGRLLKNIKVTPPKGLFDTKVVPEDEMPPLWVGVSTALLPVLLMGIAAIVKLQLTEGEPIYEFFTFIGDPIISLLITVIVAIFTLGINRGKDVKEVMGTLTESVKSIAMIMLIIGGGGAFKQVLIDSGVGDYLADILKDSDFSPLVLAWIIAASLRIALGSATVSALTTAGIVLPLIQSQAANPELMVLSTGAGSLMLSNVNDSGFWMFKEYFNLSIAQTFQSWSAMETIVSVMGLLGVLLVNQFV